MEKIMSKYGKPKSAGILAVLCGVAALLIIYTVFAPVDIIFMHDGEEVYRQENACTLSRFDDPLEHMEDAEELEEAGLEFFYPDRGGRQLFSTSSFRLRVRIAKTSLKCFVTLKWAEADRVVVCTSYYR